MPSWILLAVAERGHNHHNDNYVGKCGYMDGEERREAEEVEKKRERGGGGRGKKIRFLRRPAASFDPSLIIIVSIELITTPLAFPLSRPTVVRSVPLSSPSPSLRSSLSSSLARRRSLPYGSGYLLPRRGFAWKCNVGHHVSRLLEDRTVARARAKEARFLLARREIAILSLSHGHRR